MVGEITSRQETASALTKTCDIPELDLESPPPTIDKLSLDATSPFVDGPHLVDNRSLSDNNDITLTENSPSVENAPLVDTVDAFQATQPSREDIVPNPTVPLEGESSLDTQGESALVEMMTFLQLSETKDVPPTILQDGHGRPPTAGKEAESLALDDGDLSDQFDGDLSDADVGVDEDIVMLSPQNFRMSIDFLCHNGARAQLDGRSDTANGDSRRGSVDLSEAGDEAGRGRSRRRDRRSNAKAAAIVADPDHCITCKNFVPRHESNETGDCRRCHRHFVIYGVAWPSRSKEVIAARYKKAELEEAMKQKAIEDALEAEKTKKKKQAVDAARLAAKEEERAKQEKARAAYKAQLEQQRQLALEKIAMRTAMGLPPVERTTLSRKRKPKASAAAPISYGGYSFPADQSMQQYHQYGGAMPSMAHAGMAGMDVPLVYPQMMHHLSTFHDTTNIPIGPYPPYQHNLVYPVQQQGYSNGELGQPMVLDHPFHHAPYVVFVDPQDENPSQTWWIAVTVPRDQMDATMPGLGAAEGCAPDPDLIVVRFLEDNKYSVCNISGLKLFHPEQEPYKGYISSKGREFIKNRAVKRALAFLNGDVPAGLPWRYMSCDNQLSLTEVSNVVREINLKAQESHIHMFMRQCQNTLHQSLHHLRLLRNDSPIDPFAIQEQEQQLEQQYQHQMEQLQYELQLVRNPRPSAADYQGRSISEAEVRRIGYAGDFNRHASAAMNQPVPPYINHNIMDVQHFQQLQQFQLYQQQAASAATAKRSRKPRASSQLDDSQQPIEPDRPIRRRKGPKSLLPPQDPNEPADPNDPKAKKGRGLGKKTLHQHQFLEQSRLLEARSMGLNPLTPSDVAFLALTGIPQAQDGSGLLTVPTSKKRRTKAKSNVAGIGDSDLIKASQGEDDQSDPSALTATTSASKPRRKRAERRSVVVGSSSALATAPAGPAVPIKMMPRFCSTEPLAHRIVVMDTSPRFTSLPALLKPTGSRGPPSTPWSLSDYEYHLTERRVIEGRYNCVDITFHQDRADFIRKSQDGDMFLFDSNDLSEVSTPGSSDSTETDVSFVQRRAPDTTAKRVKVRGAERAGEGVKSDNGDKEEYADGGDNDNAYTRLTTDLFGNSELSPFMPSSISSLLGETDQEIDVVGFEDNRMVIQQDDETQFVDIEGLTPADQEAVLGLLQVGNPDFDALTTFALRQPPTMTSWKPALAPKNRRAQKPRCTSTSLNAPSTSSYSTTTGPIPGQDAIPEGGQVRVRTKKSQPAKPRKVSSSRAKTSAGGVKRRNARAVLKGSVDGEQTGVDKEQSNDAEGLTSAEAEIPVRQRQRKKRSHQELEASTQDGTIPQTDIAAAATTVNQDTTATKDSDKSSGSTPMPLLLEEVDSAASPSASSLSSFPATESPEPSSSISAFDFSDNKELQGLMQWTIKGSMIGFDLESSVRSVRSRSKKAATSISNLRRSPATTKAAKDGPAGEPLVANGEVGGEEASAPKRRKVTNDAETMQDLESVESITPKTAEVKKAGDDPTSIDNVDSGYSDVVTETVAASRTELTEPKDKVSSDDSVPNVDVGSRESSVVEESAAVAGGETTGPKIAERKDAGDGSISIIGVQLEESRVVSGAVVASEKEPAIVVVKFTLTSKEDLGKNSTPEGPPSTSSTDQDPAAVIADADAHQESAEAVPSTSSEAPKKGRGRRKKEVSSEASLESSEASSESSEVVPSLSSEEPKRPKGRRKKEMSLEALLETPELAPSPSSEEPKRTRGRKKKEVNLEATLELAPPPSSEEPKLARGRKKKVVDVEASLATETPELAPAPLIEEPKKARGRKKKIVDLETSLVTPELLEEPKKARGRKKKVVDLQASLETSDLVNEPKKARGRKKKVVDLEAYVEASDFTSSPSNEEPKKARGRKKKAVHLEASELAPASLTEEPKKARGRKKKVMLAEDDQLLQQPEARPTRKRKRQDATETGAEPLEPVVTKSANSETMGDAEASAEAEEPSVKRQRGRKSSKSKQDETPVDVNAPTKRRSRRKSGANSSEQEDDSTKEIEAPATTEEVVRKRRVRVKTPFEVGFIISRQNVSGERLRSRIKEVKLPNTSTPKFEVGDEVEAPGEENLLYDCVVKDRRDHKTLEEVYEYRVHYVGYAPKYDAWIEEKLLVKVNTKSRK
ncbi:hypothetical protein BGX33_005598 [Mortierella sp. NVP41]|nr:hypothetical protein BGX33_005598 [Mortierella sp. NVP41]